MRTTFGTFNIATTGLFASQRALDITSHNISNANTEGYSRQVALQRATQPMVGDSSGVIGTGVETYDIIRTRSTYLDNKYWNQNKSFSEWQAKENSLNEVEGIFNEPSDTGLRKVMDDFFSTLEELSKNPSDNTGRVAVLEKSNTLTASINRNGYELINSIRDINFDIKNKVEEVNSISERIVSLNQQIFSFELDGHKANDLRDQRNVLMDKLSTIVDINVDEMPGPNGNNYFDVKIGGMTLIHHFDYNKLSTSEEEWNSPSLDGTGITEMGGGKISKIIWDGTANQEVSISGGEIKGLLDMRNGDGNGMNFRGIPYYINKLNEFAQGFAAKFNEQHMQGNDLYGNQGTEFFKIPDPNKKINSINFGVNPALLKDPKLIAASSIDNGESNNANVAMLIGLRNKEIFTNVKGTSDDFIKSMLSALAVDSSQAKRMASNSGSLVEQTKIRRYSDSGVSLDEEMTNMVKFQQTYSASARMITILDRILDTTVNRLGIVGR